jgi:hypothetical protein
VIPLEILLSRNFGHNLFKFPVTAPNRKPGYRALFCQKDHIFSVKLIGLHMPKFCRVMLAILFGSWCAHAATLDVTGGSLLYTAGAAVNNQLTITVSGGNISFTDPNDSITLTANAITNGWTVNAGTTATGPASSVTTNVQVQLLTGTDQLTLNGALSVSGAVSIQSGQNITISSGGSIASSGGNVTLAATTGAIVTNTGSISAVNVALEAATGIGSSSSPVLTTVAGLVAQNTTSGGIFVSNTGPLTIGYTGDPVQGVRDSSPSSDSIVLTASGTISITGNTANEIVTAPGLVTVTATGAASDLITGNPQNTLLNATPALAGNVVSVNSIVSLSAGRDLLLGNPKEGDLFSGSSMILNAGRDITADAATQVQATGEITATAGRNVSVLHAISTGARLSANAAISVTTGAGGTFTANAQNSNDLNTAGTLTINADLISIMDSPAVFGGNGVIVAPVTTTRVISLGQAIAGQLSILDSDLASFATNSFVRVGSSTNTGGIVVNNGANPAVGSTTPAVYNNTLSLVTAGSITDGGGAGQIVVPKLALQAGAATSGFAANLTNASNGVTSFAARVSNGDLQFITSGNLSITGPIDSVTGVSVAGAHNLSITSTQSDVTVAQNVSTGGNIAIFAGTLSGGRLITNQAAISSTAAGASITFRADQQTLQGGSSISTPATGTVNLRASTGGVGMGIGGAAGPLNFSQAELNTISTGTLKLTAFADFTLNGPIVLAQVSTLDVECGFGAIVDNNGSNPDITVNNLVFTSAAGASMETAVSNLAFSNSSGSVLVENTGALTVTTVAGVSGAANAGGAVELTAGGNITLVRGVTATGSTATLISTGGNITGAANTVTNVVASSAALTAITGIGSAVTPLGITVGAVEGGTTSGGIFIANNSSLNPATLMVGGVTNSLGGLRVATSGDIQLSNQGGINITTSDNILGPGNVTVQATGDIQTSGQSAIVPYAIVSSSAGTVTVHSGGNLAVGTSGLGGIGASNGAISVTATGAITLNFGSVIAQTNASVPSPVTVTAGTNLVITATAPPNASVLSPITPAAAPHLISTVSARISNAGAGAITLTTGAGGSFVASSGNAAGDVIGGGGPITINADAIALIDTLSIAAGAGLVTIQPVTATRLIDLGTASPGNLGITSTELSSITTTNVAGVTIGGAGATFTGGITVSQPITGSPNYGNTLTLRSAGPFANGSPASGSLAVTILVFTDGSAAGHTWNVADATGLQEGSGAAIPYSTTHNLTINGGTGSDTFNITPSANVIFIIAGNTPAPPASPGDVLNVNFAGVTNPHLSDTFAASGHQGSFTFGNAQNVNYSQIESGLPVSPTLTKGFAPASIPLNGTSTLTFAITNSNSVAMAGVTFSDSLPPGVVVASTPNAINTCGGSFTNGSLGPIAAGNTSLMLTGATAPVGSCVLSVSVTGATAGTKPNTTGPISTTLTGVGGTSNLAALVVTPSITINAPAITYGANGLVTLTINTNSTTATGNVSLTPAGGGALNQSLSGGAATIAIPAPAAGTLNFNVSYSGDSNYAAASASGSLSVGKATLSVTANNQSMTFGGAVPALTYTMAGFVNGDTQQSATTGQPSLNTTATAASPVATYGITVTQGNLSAANYTFAFANGALAVTPATLTVAANSVSKLYLAPLPPFTATISGFVNGDTQASATTGSPALTTTATASSPSGSYPITSAAGTLAAANYTFTFVNGTLTITKAATVTTLVLNSGQLVATVVPVAPATGVPTGTVQFLNGTTVLGTVTLAGGTAGIPAQQGSFTAVYSGDTNFSGSTSGVVTQSTPSSTALTLSSSLNPSSLGQAVTFTAQINTSGGVSGAPSPTGTVQFFDGTKLLGTATVSSGQAAFTTSALGGGSHSIIAQYGGDSVWPAATTTYGQSVNAVVTISLTAAPPAPAVGQTVTLTANVTAATVPAGFAQPTGQVMFSIPGNTPFAPSTVLGTGTLASGVATLAVNNLPGGTVSIAATYGGDSTWSSRSTTITLTVAPAPSTSTVSLTLVSGQPVLTAIVEAAAPGAGTPTGSVQFVDTWTHATVGSATLAGGKASLTVAVNGPPQILARPVAAVYAGDSSFTGSTSSSLPAVTNVAANLSAAFAADEIAALFGVMGWIGDIPATLPLTTSIAGVTVTITDSAGTARPALLYGVFASAGQINFVIPSGTAPGLAVLTLTLPGGGTITTVINVAGSAGGVFTANQDGQGPYAGQVVYGHPDGSQTIVSSVILDPGSNTYAPRPISLSTPGDQVYLVLYGTGFLHAASVTATLNSVSLPVYYAGAQGNYPGLDQINLGPLPSSLAGAGVVNLVITADGQAANPVTVKLQ